MAVCQTCGTFFEQDEPWKKICFSCWKKSPRGKEKAKEFRQQYKPNEIREAIRYEKVFPDKEMLKRLIQLCHPDKHNNSEASGKATSWLLSIKGNCK